MTHQQALDTMAAERFLLDEMTEAEKQCQAVDAKCQLDAERRQPVPGEHEITTRDHGRRERRSGVALVIAGAAAARERAIAHDPSEEDEASAYAVFG